MATVAFVVGGALVTTENNPPAASTEKTTCLGGPATTATTLTVGAAAVAQNDPVGAPEQVTNVVFETTVPPSMVATTESPAVEVKEKGAANVKDATPEAFVVAIPVLPASGPAVILKVTTVPATGIPFDKTTAVLVMVEPAAPQMIEEVTGESAMVGTLEDAEHALTIVSLPLIVTDPFLARARPVSVPPSRGMLVNARILPAKWLPVCMVAELPTCQNTLQGDAPPPKATVAPVAVVSVLPIWKIQTSLELPVSVRVPLSVAAEE